MTEGKIHILFVCTANCCRSPLAEILFEKMLIDKLGSYQKIAENKLYIDSAAISFSGMEISENSMHVLVKEEAVKKTRCRAHYGKLITAVENPSLILVMTQDHLDHIQNNHPKLITKSYKLDDFVKADLNETGTDIFDPIGENYSQYQKMKNIVKKDLELLMEEMIDVGIL